MSIRDTDLRSRRSARLRQGPPQPPALRSTSLLSQPRRLQTHSPRAPRLRLWLSAAWRGWYDLLLLFALALLLPILPMLPSHPPVLFVLRVPLGVLSALLAPGFAMTAALLPSREHLDGPARAALSMALSIASIAVLALVLGLGPWRIRPESVAFALALWIGSFGGLASVRRAVVSLREPAAYPRTPRESYQPWVLKPRFSLPGSALVFVALAVFAGLTLMSIDRVARTTEFYMVGETGQAEFYPRQASAGQELSVTAGIANRERGTRTYRIEVWTIPPSGLAEPRLLARADGITVGRDQRWEEKVAWRLASSDEQQIQLRLFVEGRAGQPAEQTQPYRLLDLWLDAGRGS